MSCGQSSVRTIPFRNSRKRLVVLLAVNSTWAVTGLQTIPDATFSSTRPFFWVVGECVQAHSFLPAEPSSSNAVRRQACLPPPSSSGIPHVFLRSNEQYILWLVCGKNTPEWNVGTTRFPATSFCLPAVLNWICTWPEDTKQILTFPSTGFIQKLRLSDAGELNNMQYIGSVCI